VGTSAVRRWEGTKHVLGRLIDRFVLNGYELAKELATMNIVARFSRGNTAVQNGHLLDTSEIDKMRQKNAKAMKRLAKMSKSRPRVA
jgi:hypothetical protein